MRIHPDQQQQLDNSRATVLPIQWLMAEDSFAQVVIVQQHSHLSPAAEAVRIGKLETLISARPEMPSDVVKSCKAVNDAKQLTGSFCSGVRKGGKPAREASLMATAGGPAYPEVQVTAEIGSSLSPLDDHIGKLNTTNASTGASLSARQANPDSRCRSLLPLSAWFNSTVRCHFQPRSRGRDSTYGLSIGLETPQEQPSGFADMSLPAAPGCPFAHEAPGAAGAQSQGRKCTAVIRQPFNRPEPARVNAVSLFGRGTSKHWQMPAGGFPVSDSNSNSNSL